jgi:methyl-accepting chemotaxis protein
MQMTVAQRLYTKELSELLNQLSDTVDTAFEDTIRVAQALAKGDLSQKVTQLHSAAHTTVSKLVTKSAKTGAKLAASPAHDESEFVKF